MGITLGNYFSNLTNIKVSQLYFSEEAPSNSKNICHSFFRITDKDAIKSIFKRWNTGKIVSPDDAGLQKASHNIGIKNRTPIKYLLRDLLWAFSKWHTKKLRDWLNIVRPSIIFYASGDYSFSYKISVKISKELKIPLVISAMDDYWLNNQFAKKPFGKLYYRLFKKTVNKALNCSSGIVVLTEKMKEDYSKCFKKSFFILRNGVSTTNIPSVERDGVYYFGNLGLNRYKSLIVLGNAINKLNLHPNKIDVYSDEHNPNIIKAINDCPGLKLHDKIDKEKVQQLIYTARYLVHVESFEYADRTKYSFSTKIPESLASGACLIAYGPETIASIQYLKNHKCAFVVEKGKEENMKEVFLDDSLCRSISSNALTVAKKDFDSKHNALLFRQWLETIMQ